jgi:hypothetical protein
MNDDPVQIHQACFYPIESVVRLREFLVSIRNNLESEHIGFLTDERVKNQIFILSSQDLKVSVRLNISVNDMTEALALIAPNDEIEVRHLQGQQITSEQLGSIDSLSDVWKLCTAQSSTMSNNEVVSYIIRSAKNRTIKGRGKDFTVATIRQVMLDSHGYCMFEGCGEKLLMDDLTGQPGNYSYLAHNVASSEDGPRGIPFLSETLSNDPSNILLLCDKHHRLVDRVASADYPAHTLNQMRAGHIINVDKLLENLGFQPIPVFSILWPVGGQVVSPPESRDIAGSLSRLRARVRNSLNNLSSNECRYIKKPSCFAQEMDEIVTEEAQSIIGQTKFSGHKAALFAFGPMPALVGLGASIGNKSEIIPMLRYRDGNCWVWPQASKTDKPYDIVIKNNFEDASEVTLLIGLSAMPKQMSVTAKSLGFPEILITAKQMGNAAIAHPENGLELQAEIYSLLLKLQHKHNVSKVHLLICASNAACVFVGKAFDLYQPDILVYDFDGEHMTPVLEISRKKGKVTLALA